MSPPPFCKINARFEIKIAAGARPTILNGEISTLLSELGESYEAIWLGREEISALGL